MNSKVSFSDEVQHMEVLGLVDQQELYISALCWHWMPSRKPIRSHEGGGRRARILAREKERETVKEFHGVSAIGWYIYIYICLGDRVSVPGWVIPKTQKNKWYFIPLCYKLSIIRNVSREKWSSSKKGIALSSTRRCSSYWKRSFYVALNHIYIYIYIYVCVCVCVCVCVISRYSSMKG